MSALLWAPAYILPGALFGASLGIAAEIAGRLALLLVILLTLLWFSWWLVRRLSRTLQPHAEAVQLGILDWSRRHRAIEPLAAALLDPEHPEARGMTVLTGLLVLASWALLIIPRHLTADSLLGNLDLYLFYWLQGLRSPLGDRLLIVVTEIGDGWLLYSFTLLISLWLLARKRWRATLHWLITVACVGLLTEALKLYTAVERPPLLNSAQMSYAFPSAHASLSVAVFGFLAVMVARELRSNWHWVPYSMAVLMVVAIGFSRLYLGVHWLSDVLAGWSLGLAWVALMGIAYRHHPAPAVSTKIFTPLAVSTLLLLAGFYSSQQLDKDLVFYRPLTTTPVSLNRNDWIDGGWKALPAYRDDLEARRMHPLDLQWSGEIQAIETHLKSRGLANPEEWPMRPICWFCSTAMLAFENCRYSPRFTRVKPSSCYWSATWQTIPDCWHYGYGKPRIELPINNPRCGWEMFPTCSLTCACDYCVFCVPTPISTAHWICFHRISGI